MFYCDQVYRAANDAFDQYLAQHGYPLSLHGGISDTSEMMYLDKDNTWVRRDLVSSAVGDPVVVMARRSSGRIVHKTESWVTRAAQRRSWGSAHST